MKNITLSRRFFTDILSLSPESQTRVLSTCKRLADSDDDAIEQYQLPADAPDVLADFVKRLKRRVNSARRRRERRAAAPVQSSKNADKQSVAKPLTDDKRVSADAVMEMYELAVNVVVSSGNLLNRADRARIRQLAKALMKRMDNIAAITGTPPSPARRA